MIRVLGAPGLILIIVVYYSGYSERVHPRVPAGEGLRDFRGSRARRQERGGGGKRAA
jgi:hypothetical protein